MLLITEKCLTFYVKGRLIKLQGGTTQGKTQKRIWGFWFWEWLGVGVGAHNGSSQRVTLARIRGVSADGPLPPFRPY